jgi:hypothetical protein
MAIPQFVITQAGLNAASAATPNGPYIQIVNFKIGSDVGTPASLGDTNIYGTTLYQAAPTSYTFLDADTLDILIEIPPNVGPFDFGEIGLFLPGNVLFARCSFDQPQQKLQQTLNGVPNSWRVHCLLRLTQAPAVFQVTTSSSRLPEVADFSLTGSPSTMPNQPNALIVHEQSPGGESPVLVKNTPNNWTIIGYTKIGTVTPTANTLTTIDAPEFNSQDGSTAKRYLIQTTDGFVRAIQSISGSIASLSGPLPSGTNLVGLTTTLYESDFTRSGGVGAGANDYNSVAILLNAVWGPPIGSQPTDAFGWGQTEIALLNSVPTSPQWSALIDRVTKTSNYLDIPSGLGFPGFNSNWNFAPATRSAQYNTMYRVACEAYSKRLRAPFAKTQQNTVSSAQRTRNGSWVTIHHDINIAFADINAANTFFNAGGWIGFSFSVSDDNTMQSIQKARLGQLGIIRFAADFSESVGGLRIRYENGNGEAVTIGNCGYYGLTNSIQTVWSDTLFSGTEPSLSPDTALIEFKLLARRINGSQLELQFWISDSSATAYNSHSSGLGPPSAPSITSFPMFGTPPSSIMTVPTPTITTAPSTSW